MQRAPVVENCRAHRCFTIDECAAAVARGRGALDVALGETLLELSRGERLIDLGYARLVDYAFERLGIPRRTTFMLQQLAAGLASRPLLRKAVAVGAVTPRKALTVMAVATGPDEAAWVGAAMDLSGRALADRVKAGGGEVDPCFEVESLLLSMTEEEQDKLDEALALANQVLGGHRARWIRLECLAQEFLSSAPDWIPEQQAEAGGTEAVGMTSGPSERMEKAIRRQLAALEEALGVIEGMEKAPPETNAMALDGRAKRLARARLSRDSALGPLLVTIADERIHREVGYTRFEDYCRDRLGMTARAARERIWLERKMCALPELRDALDRGRITFTKALLIAKGATPFNIEERIADAETTTGQQVEREATKEEDRKNRAQGKRRLWGPREAMETISLAIVTAQRLAAAEGEDIDAGAALAAVAEVFSAVWTEHLRGRGASAKRLRILARTDGLCAVPVCRRPAEHLHHITFRSSGGGNGDENYLGLCAICHQRGVHRGRIRVVGQAGEVLLWELGAVDGRPVEVWMTTGDDDVRRR